MPKPVIECEHCGYDWCTSSSASRPTCPECTRKTDRLQVAEQATVSLTEVVEEQLSLTDVAGELRRITSAMESLADDGWEVVNMREQSATIVIQRSAERGTGDEDDVDEPEPRAAGTQTA